MLTLYGIASTPLELKRYVDLGVPLIQYRNKEEGGSSISSLPTGESRIIINDSIEEAERLNAWAVHLGQEDIERYENNNPDRLANRTVKLGISTHNDHELERSLRYSPDYIAFGPIFLTTSKTLPYSPAGIEELSRVVKRVSVPVIAIGGINRDNYEQVVGTGAYAIAVISALKNMSDEEIKEWLTMLAKTG